MTSKKKIREPFEIEITALGKGGVGVGTLDGKQTVEVAFAPPGSRLLVAPVQTKKHRWLARRLEVRRPPSDAVVPSCPVFGLCGGCSLQELPLEAQRASKYRYALECVATPLDKTVTELHQEIQIHPVRGSQQAYHYRNKVEWTWGNRRILTQPEFEAGVSFHGRYLGFHAPGHFDRIADSPSCHLVSEPANLLYQTLRTQTLHDQALPVWDAREHRGFWRHVMLREGFATGQLMVVLYTAPAQTDTEVQAVEQVVRELQDTSLPTPHRLVSVIWIENAGVADVAQGEVRHIWGQDHIEEHLGHKRYHLSAPSFFQTSTVGAEILYETIREALGDQRGTLYDLYCGTGSIGIYVGDAFAAVVGIEEVREAICDAQRNAKLNNMNHTTYWASSMEHALERMPQTGRGVAIVVDPPRAGLHPKVSQALAQSDAEVLLYVACHPPSLGKDASILQTGGWKITDLWAVDLFPQTGHLELVARLCKNP